MATQTTMLLETKGLQLAYLGAAIGFINTIGRVGEIVSPPLGNSLAEINPQFPFLMWGGMAVVALIIFLFFKKDKDKKDKEETPA